MIGTLADALPREIARIQAKKERWGKMLAGQPPITRIAVNIMQAEIEASVTNGGDA